MAILNYTTKVGVPATAAEIQKILTKAGAQAIMREAFEDAYGAAWEKADFATFDKGMYHLLPSKDTMDPYEYHNELNQDWVAFCKGYKASFAEIDRLEKIVSDQSSLISEIVKTNKNKTIQELSDQSMSLMKEGDRLRTTLAVAGKIYAALLTLAEYHGPGTCPNYTEMNEAVLEWEALTRDKNAKAD